MKNRFLAIVLGLLVSTSLFAVGSTVEIEVTGMTCPFCTYGVKKQLEKLPGVEKAQASLELKKARIVMKDGVQPDLDAIRTTLINAGFTPGEVHIK